MKTSAVVHFGAALANDGQIRNENLWERRTSTSGSFGQPRHTSGLTHTRKYTQTHTEGERRSVDSDVGSEREREHAQVAAAAANSCHSTTAHAFDRGCNARESHTCRESKNKSERLSVAWEHERAKAKSKSTLCFFAALFVWLFRGWQTQHLPVTFCCCCYEAKQQSKRGAKKTFFFIVAILQWPHTIHEIYMHINSMYTYTHTDTRLHMDWCTYIQYCMEVHRLCTLALATWNGKITLSPIRRRLFCLPRFVCVCCCFTYFPITIDIVYYLLVNFSPTLFACKRF